MKKFDLIIFGATGFTGKEVAKYLASCQLTLHGKRPLHWAIAGRDRAKLEQLRLEIPLKNPSDLAIIIADTKDDASLGNMCKQAQVLINCVGPFRFHGLPVVEACIKNRCHYLDISGETQFIELCQLKYHRDAIDNNVLVIPACGFDSIPAEMGVQFLTRKARQKGLEIESIESFMRVEGGEEGITCHYTTFESAVHGVGNWNKLGDLRQKLIKERWPKKLKLTGGPLPIKKYPFFDPREKSWCFLFPGADAAVVKSTQRSLASLADSGDKEDEEGIPPHYTAYYSFAKLSSILSSGLSALLFLPLAKTSWGRSLLLKFPEFFSSGVISRKGPSRKQMNETTFRINFYGKSAHGNKSIAARVSGPEPGYVATPIIVVQAAYYLLEEREKIDLRGVFTPGVVFRNPKFLSLLGQSGITFQLESME